MSHKELARVEALFFDKGSYPWTNADFYNNSAEQWEAAPTVDPIVITQYEFEGPRVAENDCWWEGLYVWSEWPLQLDDDLKLLEPVVRLLVQPICLGASDKEYDDIGLLPYEMSNVGHVDTFLKCRCDLVRAAEYIRRKSIKKSILPYAIWFLTTWECDAGIDPDTWMGPGEYWTSYELIGVVSLDDMKDDDSWRSDKRI